MMIVRRGALPMAAGVAGGLAAVVLLGRVIAGMLYGLDPLDPWVLAGAAGALAVIGIVACCWPALRATRIDPTEAMRADI